MEKQENTPLFVGGNCTIMDGGGEYVIRIPKGKTLKVSSEGKSILLASVKAVLPVEGTVSGASLTLNLFRPPMNDDEQKACQRQAAVAATIRDAKAGNRL